MRRRRAPVDLPIEKRFVYKGYEIASAVGVPATEIHVYVEKHGLPAWKHNGGAWLAVPEDLHAWVKTQRDKHLKQSGKTRVNAK